MSTASLLVLARLLDLEDVWIRLSALDARWVALGLGLSAIQVVLLAWRWRFTAAQLGVDLPFPVALREYYLGILLNQILPGGVAGDVSRAWRHARTDAPAGAAVRAVILERLVGQLVMTTVAAACAGGLAAFGLFGDLAGAVAVALAIPSVGAWAAVRLAGRVRRRLAPDSRVGRFHADAAQALAAPTAAAFQWGSAIVVVSTYLVIYLIAARAVGVETSTVLLAPLVAPVLMTMLIPVTVAGWGVREGAAALLWGAAGLTPEDGVAISVAYGLLVLVAALPGVLALIGPRSPGRADRGRTDGHAPAESGDRPDGGRPPTTRSPEG